MGTSMDKNEWHPFIKKEILKTERRWFTIKILTITAGYTIITLWLNAIRQTAPLWFVWLLIIIQLTLYFLIFFVSYLRANVCGLNKNLSLILFATLTVLGRIIYLYDWELLIIPILVISMLWISAKNKNISDYWRGRSN